MPGCDEASNYDGCFARPDSVLVYDYPNTTASGEWYHSAYVNDKITMTRKLTVNVGVRYDRYSSFLPEQGNPGTGPVRDARTSSRIRVRATIPVYSTFVPRVSAVYDLTGEGRVARARELRPVRRRQLGRVGQPGPGRDGRQPERDHHPDLLQLGWQHPVRAGRGEPHLDVGRRHQPRASIRDLKGPYVDEYTAGLDIGLSRALTVQFNYVRKTDGSRQQAHQPGAAVRRLHGRDTVVDPGRDNVTGTSDDASRVVYSVPRTYPTFGQIIERIVQRRREGNNRYDAYGVTLNKQLSNNWSFLASFNVDCRDLRGHRAA